MTYTHRNGEKELPTVCGWFWAQDDRGCEQCIYVSDSTWPNNDPLNIVAWEASYIGNEMDFHADDFAGWRWWGPIELPDMRGWTP